MRCVYINENKAKKTSKRMDISGQRYGSLSAIRFVETDRHGNSVWECRCDCGERSYARLGALRAGRIKQCKRCQSNSLTKNHIKNKRLKSIYTDMIRRCYDPNREFYSRYGGRGIRVCKEWIDDPLSFENWALNNGYSDDLTLDRIDNDGDYEPFNCRWADGKTQGNNRSNNRILEYNGTAMTLTQWAEKLGVHTDTLRKRIENGESEDSVFNSKDIRQQKSRSGIKGISWNSYHGRWQVRVRENKKRISLGSFKDLEDAIYALEYYHLHNEKMPKQ